MLRDLFLPSHNSDLERLEEAIYTCGGLAAFMKALERAGLLKTRASSLNRMLHSPPFSRVAGFVSDVFDWACVSKSWRERIGSGDIWSAVFSAAVKIRCSQNVRTVVTRIPSSLHVLRLNFDDCRIGDGGARAVAEKLPAGLIKLSFEPSYNVVAEAFSQLRGSY